MMRPEYLVDVVSVQKHNMERIVSRIQPENETLIYDGIKVKTVTISGTIVSIEYTVQEYIMWQISTSQL